MNLISGYFWPVFELQGQHVPFVRHSCVWFGRPSGTEGVNVSICDSGRWDMSRQSVHGCTQPTKKKKRGIFTGARRSKKTKEEEKDEHLPYNILVFVESKYERIKETPIHKI